jgi:hypothetical protein
MTRGQKVHANRRTSQERWERHKAYMRQWNQANKEKRAAYMKEWREGRTPEKKAEDRDRLRSHMLRRTYGITSADYDALVLRQGGCCAICGTDKPKGHGSRLHVDHDHITGRVRGLLCHLCNTRLAWYERLGKQVTEYLAPIRMVHNG